jgi:hypothetical protein
MAFVLHFLLRAFPAVVEPMATKVDDFGHDLEAGKANTERARLLKAHLVSISEIAAATDVDAATIIAGDLLRGIVSAASDDAKQAVARGPQWLWSLVHRALRLSE